MSAYVCVYVTTELYADLCIYRAGPKVHVRRFISCLINPCLEIITLQLGHCASSVILSTIIILYESGGSENRFC